MLFQKNVAIVIEFGDYGNVCSMIPLEIVKQFYCNGKPCPEWVIKFAFDDNSNRTINLVIEENEIDFDSFK